MNGETGSTDVVAQLTQAANDWLAGGDSTPPAPTPAAVSAALTSNVLPPIDLAGGGGSGLGGTLLRWIQPTITGQLPVLGPVNIAPYGVANPLVGTIVFYTVLGLATYGAYKLFR